MPQSYDLKLGQAIRRLREAGGMNRLQLAKRAKVAYGLVRLAEQGQSLNLTLRTILKLSRTLRVSPSKLIELSQDKSRDSQKLPSTIPPEILRVLRRPKVRFALTVLKGTDLRELQKLLDFLLKVSA